VEAQHSKVNPQNAVNALIICRFSPTDFLAAAVGFPVVGKGKRWGNKTGGLGECLFAQLTSSSTSSCREIKLKFTCTQKVRAKWQGRAKRWCRGVEGGQIGKGYRRGWGAGSSACWL